MTLNQKIRDHLMEKGRHVQVREVRIGLSYTAVMLESGQTGVAFTFKDSTVRGCPMFSDLKPLSGKGAWEILSFLDSSNRIEAAVALATANALANVFSDPMLEGDILEHLAVHPDDQVGMVGYFGPVLPELRKKTDKILIFEQIKEKTAELLPEEEAYRLLPQCQIAMITSTTLINQSVDRLLEAAKGCREVILLGASTPMVREAFLNSPATYLSGVVVIEPDEILRIVSEGGGMRRFKNCIRKVNLTL